MALTSQRCQLRAQKSHTFLPSAFFLAQTESFGKLMMFGFYVLNANALASAEIVVFWSLTLSAL